jgi:opacity protein-like surface antigen
LEIPVISRWLGVVCVVAAAAAIPAPAFAQEGRWFAGGLGGVTFGTPTSGAIAGRFGVRLNDYLFAIAEAGRMQNVMPKEIDEQIDSFLADFDAPFSLSISVPANYLLGGMRWEVASTRTSPFVEGGIGFAHISLKLSPSEIFGIDIAQLVADEVGATTANKGLLALGGGVTTRLGQSAALDIGYRYTRIYTGKPDPDVSLVYAAVKFGR